MPILYIDDTTAEKQLAGSTKLRRTRDNDAVAASLDALQAPLAAPDNMMPPIARLRPRLRNRGRDVRCAARRCGGNTRKCRSFSSSYSSEAGSWKLEAERMRKIRVVIAKPGLDGHDRVRRSSRARCAMPAWRSSTWACARRPSRSSAAALQEDADAIGLSILSGAHMHICPRVLELLEGARARRRAAGGRRHHPGRRYPKTARDGREGHLPPRTPMQQIVEFIQANVRPRVEQV